MRAIPYLRVSTDDKGQHPDRQLQVIGPWAARERVELLVVVEDEGASASTSNPFERSRFVLACELAVAAGAEAIVVATTACFTNGGAFVGESKIDAWAEIELRRRYGLRLLRADKPLSLHDTAAGNLMDACNSAAAARNL